MCLALDFRSSFYRVHMWRAMLSNSPLSDWRFPAVTEFGWREWVRCLGCRGWMQGWRLAWPSHSGRRGSGRGTLAEGASARRAGWSVAGGAVRPWRTGTTGSRTREAMRPGGGAGIGGRSGRLGIGGGSGTPSGVHCVFRGEPVVFARGARSTTGYIPESLRDS